MRVLITVASLGREFGGPVSNAFGLAEGLRVLGHEVLVTGVGSASGALSLPRLATFRSTPIPSRVQPLLIPIRDADVVHVMGFRDPVGTAAALMARRVQTPYILEPGGMHRRLLRSYSIKWAFDRILGRVVVGGAARLVAVSHIEAQDLEDDGIRSERIRVRPNGLTFGSSDPVPEQGKLRRKLGIPLEVPLILSLGRIAAIKGLLHLAEALGRLDGAWALIVGPAERDGTFDALVQARKSLGLGERLVLVPEGMWGTEKAAAFADADAFCMASMSECFGISALEAAAAGLPVVITDRCGVVDCLDSAATRVIPYGDVTKLAGALKDVIENNELRATARRTAPNLLRAFDWRALASSQAGIYSEVI